MTISLKTTTVRTLCGGGINSLVDRTKKSANIKFEGISECHQCPVCPYRLMCPVDRKTTLKTIEVKAYNGLVVGMLPIVNERRTYIEVETRKGRIIRFDRTTGVQRNAIDSKFANTIDPSVLVPYKRKPKPKTVTPPPAPPKPPREPRRKKTEEPTTEPALLIPDDDDPPYVYNPDMISPDEVLEVEA